MMPCRELGMRNRISEGDCSMLPLTREAVPMIGVQHPRNNEASRSLHYWGSACGMAHGNGISSSYREARFTLKRRIGIASESSWHRKQIDRWIGQDRTRQTLVQFQMPSSTCAGVGRGEGSELVRPIIEPGMGIPSVPIVHRRTRYG